MAVRLPLACPQDLQERAIPHKTRPFPMYPAAMLKRNGSLHLQGRLKYQEASLHTSCIGVQNTRCRRMRRPIHQGRRWAGLGRHDRLNSCRGLLRCRSGLLCRLSCCRSLLRCRWSLLCGLSSRRSLLHCRCNLFCGLFMLRAALAGHGLLIRAAQGAGLLFGCCFACMQDLVLPIGHWLCWGTVHLARSGLRCI